jgi:hypothetical protein
MKSLLAFALTQTACSASAERDAKNDDAPAPPLDPGTVDGSKKYEDSVDALFDVLVPGAREAQAGRFFGDRELVSLVTGLGLLSTNDGEVLDALTDASGGLRSAINAMLDGLAARRAPLSKFSELSLASRTEITNDAYDADSTKPLVEIVRVIAFVAYLGATYSDAGLVAIGFPPYEDFEAGIAVSGYPRTTSGRLVDATEEDLRALAKKGELDDYTYDEGPGPFAVALGLDERGDLP